jgi:hypothetical protein
MLASAEWLLLAVALVWGTSYGVAKLALEHYPVFGVLANMRCPIVFSLLRLTSPGWLGHPTDCLAGHAGRCSPC